MNIPDNLKYTEDHEWVSIDGNVATLGITDYAQIELGDIVFLDIDSEISEVKKGEPFGTVEAVKTVSDIYSPFSGKVKEFNSTLLDTPELINSDPYGKGWMIKAEMDSPSELNDLMDSTDYKKLIGQ